MSDTENPDGQEPEATPDETPAAETPAEPEAPITPSEPEAPVTPPSDPPEPTEPATPAEPAEPATPAVPSEPATPTSPAEPEAPIAPPTGEAGTGNTPFSAEDDQTPPAHDVPAVDGAERDSGAPVAGAPTPAADAGEDAAAEDAAAEDADGEELTPRQRPEIPGADLVPDLVAEGDEYLDAESRAAAEADAEAAAARAQDEDSDQHSQPIADAAIDLASGARYVATGKRKTAVARVILRPGTGGYVINGKPMDEFFPRATLQRVIRQPLEAVGFESRMDVVARMHGGGVAAQAGALRHGISRALLEADPNLRGELKRRGFLTRDPRVKERKKAGLKKARKRPQFSKR